MTKTFTIIIILSAVLVGILYAGPQVLIWRAVNQSGQNYLEVQYNNEANELEMDLPRAREIYDGHFPPSELFLDKRGPTPLNPLPVLMLALPMFLFGGNINLAYLASQFVFSALIFLAFYFAGWAITDRRSWSLFLAFVGILTPLARYMVRAFSSFDYFLNLVAKNFYPLVNSSLDVLFLHKVVDPLITFVFYIPAIAALIWFWIQPRKSNALLAGLLIGLMFYTYWHYWVYLIIVIGLLGVYVLLRRKADPERFRLFLILGAVLLAALIPYLFNYWLFQNMPAASEIIARQGVVESGRYFRISGVIGDYIFYSAAAVIIYFVFWKSNDKKNYAVLFWAFIAAIFIAWNIQLVAGFTLVANHWWLSFAPVGLMIGFSVFYELAERWIRDKRILKVGLAVLIILLVVKKVVNILIFVHPDESLIKKYSYRPDVIASWDWMNGNLPGEPKIISPAIIDSMYLTIYSSSRPYLPFYTNTLATNAELEKRFLISQKLFGVSRENLEKELRWRSLPESCQGLAKYFDHRNLRCDSYTSYSFQNGRFLYGFYYLPKEYHTVGSSVKPRWDIPEEKIKELLHRYDQLKVSWKDIDADYVYYGPWEKNLANVDLKYDKDLELVYQKGEMEIYKIKHDGTK